MDPTFTPIKIPLTRPLADRDYFIRDCFNHYYRLILESRLDRVDWAITLSGTIGTGKSVFYTYFVERFRKEHPDTHVLLAAFSSDGSLRECVEYLNSGDPGKKLNHLPTEYCGAYILCDGNPSRRIQIGLPIFFTRFSSEWHRECYKDATHRWLYWPSWSLEELLRANATLQLGIDPGSIKDRFEFFGGVVRYCLSQSDSFVSAGRLRVLAVIESLRDPSQMDNCEPVELMDFHPLYPLSPGYRTFDPQFASKTIAQLVLERVQLR